MSDQPLSSEIRKLFLDNPAGSINLGSLVLTLESHGFGLFLAILAFPSALPIPAPGYSTPMGIAIILIGTQMVLGRTHLWLPKSIQSQQINTQRLEKASRTIVKLLLWTEKWIQPRLQLLASGTSIRGIGVLVCLMAALMILPIPLTNTLPAIVIFLISIGLTEKDGLLNLLALLIGIGALALYTVIIYFIATRGLDWVQAQLA